MLFSSDSLLYALPLAMFVVAAAIVDVRERRIPNGVVLAGSASGLAIALTGGAFALANSAGGVVSGILILFPAFAMGWLGAGDVKLMGAVGSFVGVTGLPRALFYSALAGGALAAVALAMRPIRRRSLPVESRRALDSIPYGVAIGLGALLASVFDPRGDWAGF